MNRSTLIQKTAKETGHTVGAVERVITAFFDLATDALCSGESVSIRKFGKIELRLRGAMDKPNPKTGETMTIPERLSVALLPSDLLKERLNR